MQHLLKELIKLWVNNDWPTKIFSIFAPKDMLEFPCFEKLPEDAPEMEDTSSFGGPTVEWRKQAPIPMIVCLFNEEKSKDGVGILDHYYAEVTPRSFKNANFPMKLERYREALSKWDYIHLSLLNSEIGTCRRRINKEIAYGK